ncbi:PH domain-containing protein [Klenkia soli]|uniref:PH domain-containing protein n=1 Tax=Klenkia soli TaxID=1052260 RepID=A0A1H0RAX7_9ACTN|nr:PH domain-containing protein [Klenkia soli]SDP26176.1 PH domain-containing protein [Klenkia soli]
MQWSTRRAETLAAGAVAVLLGAGALLVDQLGRVLVGAAALLLLGVVVRDLVLRPRLRADEGQVVVRSLTGTTVIPRDRLLSRVRTARRLGLRTTTLELEDTADDTVLVVLGRRDLGADPAQVGAEVLGHRPGQPGPGRRRPG